jgi:hypothetical protein
VLAGEYGVGYVGGMQAGRSSQTVNLSMAVCNAKHWSAYDVESGSTNDGTGDKYNRGSFNAEIPLQDLIESYWAQFTTVVREANLGGTMCSCTLRCACTHAAALSFLSWSTGKL